MIFRGSLAAEFILLTLIRVYYARKAGKAGEKVSVDGEGKLGAALLRLCNSLAAIATLMYLVAPQRMRWSALPMPVWLRWIGVVAGLVTVALFLWVHHTLGENWSTSVETKEGHKLITGGPYRWVRHPMYTTIFVWSLIQTRLEDRRLIVLFGDEARRYVAAVPGYVPRWAVYER